MTDQFYTPYERQEHRNLQITFGVGLLLFALKNLKELKRVKPTQKVVRRYVINADYEYKPELKEVRNEQDRPAHS